MIFGPLKMVIKFIFPLKMAYFLAFWRIYKTPFRIFFLWYFLLPIKIGCKDYGRKKIHEEMVSENMFFWLVKLVRKINIFVENGCSLHFHEFQKCPSGYSVAVLFVAQQNGGEWFTRNKKTRSNYVPEHGFWSPKKGSGLSFLVKLAYFGHFQALQNYTCLRWFLLTKKIGGESTPNYDFFTPENGH